MIDLLAAEYGWNVDYILDLPVRQVTRLVETVARRTFTNDILTAQLQEVAIARALAGAFGKDRTSQPWPNWEDVKEGGSKLSAPMARLRDQALE